MKITKIASLFLALSAIIWTSCTLSATKHSDEAADKPAVLVAYFSAQGHTKALAEKIAAATGGTLFEIQPTDPYTEADLDGWNDSARGTRESKDRSTRPGIKNKVVDFEKYDTVYLGFPIWWYTAPTIINTFLESYDTAGKTIIPFATSGGSNFGDTEKDLRVSAPKAIFKPGRVINNATQQQVDEWVKSVSK